MKSASLISLSIALLGSLIANATQASTIATFTVVETDVVTAPNFPGLSGSGTGSGTAVLDSSGLLTMHLSGTTVIDYGTPGYYAFTTTADTTFSGAWTYPFFTPASGQPNWTSCNDFGTNQTACSSLYPYGTGSSTFLSVSGQITMDGGTLNADLLQAGVQLTSSTYELTPAVPLPPAAGLFGSACLAIAGLRRKRHQA